MLYGEGKVRSEAYGRYVVCKEMGWDYYTFMAQPPFFIEEVLIIMNQQSQKEQKEISSAERKSKMSRPSPHVPHARRR